MVFSIKLARTYAGYSQHEMADALGMSIGKYRRIEENPYTATITDAIAISNITKVPVDTIFFGS